MTPKQNKPYVLVVEDDPEIRDMILKILDGMDLASGYELPSLRIYAVGQNYPFWFYLPVLLSTRK